MIWCLGMYSSGSTWLYNAVRAVAAQAGAVCSAGYADNLRALTALLAADAQAIVKTHELDPKTEEFAARRARAILVSIRDPRDAVVSIMERLQVDAATALMLVERSALQVSRFRDHAVGTVFRYEAGFIDDPATFDALAGVFGVRLENAMRARLFEESRRAVIDAEIARMTAAADPRIVDVVDAASQWHAHHGNRTGEVGRWARVLSPEVAAMVVERLGGWMSDFGYEVDGAEKA